MRPTGLSRLIDALLLAALVSSVLPVSQAGAADAKPSLSLVEVPPKPLANLRVYDVTPNGVQKIVGGPDEDLLAVAPAGVIDGKFQLDVQGFRGIYLIGATFDPQPMGDLVTPSGKTAGGLGTVLRLQTHASPVSRPFVYVSRLRLKADHVAFGDFLQVGGAAPLGDWAHWPDLYRYKIKADAFYGWYDYAGGSMAKNVSHSDFMKMERGGVRRNLAADIDVTWGYQAEYLTPAWIVKFQPYAGPEGYGEHHFWNYVARVAVNEELGSQPDPNLFFFSRGSETVAKGEYHTTYFHGADGQGQGVFLVPPPGTDEITPYVHPGKGPFAPIDRGDYLEWPQTGQPGGRPPLVVGRLMDGARVKPPVMVREDEVGWQHRVRSAAELMALIGKGPQG